MLLAGIVALIIVVVAYLYVSVGSVLWPGGPELSPPVARNLSILLLLAGLLLCGALIGTAGQQLALQPTLAAGGGATPGPGTGVTAAAATDGADATRIAAATLSRSTATPTAGAAASPTNPPATPSPTRPAATPSPSATSSPTPGPTPAPTGLPTALPLEPSALVETVLREVIERANAAQVSAILSGDEGDVDPWWAGAAREVAIGGVRSVRSRFAQISQVSWEPVGQGIQLLANTTVTATYTTSERWTYVGSLNEPCPDGSLRQRRAVETYPSEQYTLRLQDGVYSVVEWQIGGLVVDEDRVFCPGE